MSMLPARLVRSVNRAANSARGALRAGAGLVSERIREAQLSADFSPQADDRFIVGAYFGSDLSSAYQLEQWLWPFERLADTLRTSTGSDQPVGILVRSPTVAERLRAQTNLPVRFSRLSAGLDAFMTGPSLRLVFYVNQATGNFQPLKFPRPAHVHLSHGESEKISMVSNQLKAYDYIFTSGRAARDRIAGSIIGIDDARMIDVGRPQLDRPRCLPEVWRDFDSSAPSGPTVFYAPTWEGDSPAMAYGTLAYNGETLVRALLDAGYRVIFRPHPRIGIRESRFSRALASVESLIEAAPRGFMDRTSDVSWQLDASDVALAEMSSVAFDWLSVTKPLVMIAPHDTAAYVRDDGLLTKCPQVRPGDESTIIEIVAAARTRGNRQLFVDLGDLYLGATGPGVQVDRFVTAAQSVLTARGRELDERR